MSRGTPRGTAASRFCCMMRAARAWGVQAKCSPKPTSRRCASALWKRPAPGVSFPLDQEIHPARSAARLRPGAEGHPEGGARHRPRGDLPWRAQGLRRAAERGLPGVRSRRCRARSPAGPQAKGLRRRHRRVSRGSAQALPALAADRAALQARARDVRRGDRGGVHFSRAHRRGDRRAWARASGQHLRHARGRRHPARLHRQCPVLRSGERDPSRLPQRPERPAAKVGARHRRRAGALPGGPGAHAARRALRGEARLHPRRAHEKTHQRDGAPPGERAAVRSDARARYREDPVRMLRAARFAAKLGFTLDERTRKPISEMAHLLENVPPSRVYEEMQKLLLSGHAATSLRQLRSEGLHRGLLPLLDVMFEQPMGERFVSLALEQIDCRVRSGKSVSPAFLFAALLWHEVLAAWKKARERGLKPIPALYQAMDAVLDIQTDKLAIPRRFTAVMKEIWALQPRFEQRSGRRPFALMTHERFRAGFDFLVLRCASGEAPEELSRWWQKFQDAGEDERQSMLLAAPPAPPAQEGGGASAARRRTGLSERGRASRAPSESPLPKR